MDKTWLNYLDMRSLIDHLLHIHTHTLFGQDSPKTGKGASKPEQWLPSENI